MFAFNWISLSALDPQMGKIIVLFGFIAFVSCSVFHVSSRVLVLLLIFINSYRSFVGGKKHLRTCIFMSLHIFINNNHYRLMTSRRRLKEPSTSCDDRTKSLGGIKFNNVLSLDNILQLTFMSSFKSIITSLVTRF